MLAEHPLAVASQGIALLSCLLVSTCATGLPEGVKPILTRYSSYIQLPFLFTMLSSTLYKNTQGLSLRGQQNSPGTYKA